MNKFSVSIYIYPQEIFILKETHRQVNTQTSSFINVPNEELHIKHFKIFLFILGYTCHSTYVEVRGQLERVCSSFCFVDAWVELSLSAMAPASSLTEPAHSPCICFRQCCRGLCTCWTSILSLNYTSRAYATTLLSLCSILKSTNILFHVPLLACC